MNIVAINGMVFRELFNDAIQRPTLHLLNYLAGKKQNPRKLTLSED
jgi:hypothetical protein